MIPGSFDPDTSREMVGHDRALSIEKKARDDADNGKFDPPPKAVARTYWDSCQNDFQYVTYCAQYEKRMAKIKRTVENEPVNQDVLVIVKDVVGSNAKAVSEYLAGKEKALNSLLGMVLKTAKGKGIADVDPSATLLLIKGIIADKPR